VSPLEIKAARLALSMNQREFAEALRVAGEATVRSWESGRRPIGGPATVAIELMLKHGAPPKSKEWWVGEATMHPVGKKP
jgi:DNA-binding transcriptional regulator YiaG